MAKKNEIEGLISAPTRYQAFYFVMALLSVMISITGQAYIQVSVFHPPAASNKRIFVLLISLKKCKIKIVTAGLQNT